MSAHEHDNDTPSRDERRADRQDQDAPRPRQGGTPVWLMRDPDGELYGWKD